MRLQSIVTKEIRPEDFAVVACASIRGGSTANIVPDFVYIKVTIRSYKPEIHESLVAAVKRVVGSECEASGSLAVHELEYKTIMHMPATVNDLHNTAILKAQFKEYFGANAIDKDLFGVSEDFSVLATACGAPSVFYMWGCVDEETWKKAKREGTTNEIPHDQSAFFTPVIQPTMETGVDAFSMADLTLLGKGEEV